MSDTLFSLIADWGVALMALVTFLSCLALPVPASLAMLAAGAFSAGGDFTLASVALAAFLGAVAGDQAGYVLARAARPALLHFIATRPRRRALLDRARHLTESRGGPGVFFSRWLVSPLGPYANFAAGLVGMSLRRFVRAQAIAGIPVALLFAWIGERFLDRPAIGFALGLGLPVLLWAVLRASGLLEAPPEPLPAREESA